MPDDDLAKFSTAGYHPHYQRPGGSYSSYYAQQAQRHMRVYGETRKHVNRLMASALSRPRTTPTVAVAGSVPAGYGGSGYSGSPQPSITSSPLPGRETLPPPPAVG
jgi:hypothetical protein